ncbi:universal stress protein [Vibrio gallicus]|uniref:universal stress protein n=1 Tax=Vibrio gallicus TaxID=190897 RepID=UPI0021C29F3D|nr:universal stress protein [Vibrio gallicus]
MSYQHIVVAVDLSEHSAFLVNKAAGLAKAVGAELSVIHIDVNYNNIYAGLIDVNLVENQKSLTDHSTEKLQALADQVDYPISHVMVGRGDLTEELADAIAKQEFDLVVCGHHHDFWGKLLSNTRHLVHDMPIDLLVVPLD